LWERWVSSDSEKPGEGFLHSYSPLTRLNLTSFDFATLRASCARLGSHNGRGVHFRRGYNST
jgi:hypothetical protein